MQASNKNHGKRRFSVRGDRSRHGAKGRPWAGKPSVLANQNVKRRNKKVVFKGGGVNDTRARLKGASSWMPESQGGEWRSRFLEGGFFLAAGLSNVVKNGVDHLTGWVKGGREAVENVSIPPLKFGQGDERESHDVDRVEPEMADACESENHYEEWSANPSEVVAEAGMELHDRLEDCIQPSDVTDVDPLRDNIEWHKMHSQEEEEFGLGADELEDQAGALRNMFSNRNVNEG